MFVRQRANASSFENQTRVLCNVLSDPILQVSTSSSTLRPMEPVEENIPPPCKRSQDMSMRHDQDIERLLDRALRFANRVRVESLSNVLDQRIQSLRDLLWRPTHPSVLPILALSQYQ